MKRFEEWAKGIIEEKQGEDKVLRIGDPINTLVVGVIDFKAAQVIVDIGDDYEFLCTADDWLSLLKERTTALEVIKKEVETLESYIEWRKRK